MMVEASTLPYLTELRSLYPNIKRVLAAIATCEGRLRLPTGSIHIISDIHGESKKLRHIVNNASGFLKQLVDTTFASRLSEGERRILLTYIYYPQERLSVECFANEDERSKYLTAILEQEIELLRVLVRDRTVKSVEAIFPTDFIELFRELVYAPQSHSEHLRAMISVFLQHNPELLLRSVARAIRNLSISELIVAGDLGDRGPRIDRVIATLMQQPSVSLTWGNHDATWMAACLGHEASIATIIRISLRYRTLSQLEEGYGIPMAPLEKLAREVYSDDPATCFLCKGHGLRDPLQMARMQKAIAILQFKLEGQLTRRNPSFLMEARNFLHQIDPIQGTVVINGSTYPLRDTSFPTIDWSDPYALSPEEATCIERLTLSFVTSPVLWEQMQYVQRIGSMYLVRHQHLIFHACVPVDEDGEFLEFTVDGTPKTGKALFDALQAVIERAFREKRQDDLDMLWYLWAGSRSPWFGKDKMATFEGYFVTDESTHKETKNAYFSLLHETWFCEKILREFNVDTSSGVIVNGHVPVKIDAGESPVKRSGKAVTIDGAFSEAYGDKGYTLILNTDQSSLVLHHHFDSVKAAIEEGLDIIPQEEHVWKFPTSRTVAESEEGERIRNKLHILKTLLQAYSSGTLKEDASLSQSY